MNFRFTKFKVYAEAKELHRITVNLTRKFSKEYAYLKEQLRRASLSIILNIAEGSAKKSDKDFNRYLENSLGSVNELAAGFDVAFDQKQITEEELKLVLQKALSVKNQLGGFSKKLRVNS